jgi:RimJ/RimL family protein N-acetyltransferase
MEPHHRSTRESLARYWPLYGLRLETPRLQLTVLADEDLPELIELVLAGVHAPERMPFAVPWTDAPPDQLIPNTLRFHWQERAGIVPGNWRVPFAVRRNGILVGLQELAGRDFPLLRTVHTGSWLGLAHQGEGIGTEMRVAVLQFAFEQLHAERAESGAFTDNPSSLRISAKLGYRTNGMDRQQRRPGEVVAHQRLVLEPAEFRRPDWTVAVTGLEACRDLLQY